MANYVLDIDLYLTHSSREEGCITFPLHLLFCPSGGTYTEKASAPTITIPVISSSTARIMGIIGMSGNVGIASLV